MLVLPLLQVAAAACLACNPLTSRHCQPNRALATTVTEHFHHPPLWMRRPVGTHGGIRYTPDGCELVIEHLGDSPELELRLYLMFGRVEAEIKVAPGVGIVLLLYLQSDVLDEIDFEWFGGDPFETQTNWFRTGNTSTYDRSRYHATVPPPQEHFHTYAIEWTPRMVSWLVDGHTVRTLAASHPQGFPQTPMKVVVGSWVGGSTTNAPGTIAWAGGLSDMSAAPFTMVVRRLSVLDYSLGYLYIYTGRGGTALSVTASGGHVCGRVAEAAAEWLRLVGSGWVAPTPAATEGLCNPTGHGHPSWAPSTDSDSGNGGAAAGNHVVPTGAAGRVDAQPLLWAVAAVALTCGV